MRRGLMRDDAHGYMRMYEAACDAAWGVSVQQTAAEGTLGPGEDAHHGAVRLARGEGEFYWNSNILSSARFRVWSVSRLSISHFLKVIHIMCVCHV